MAARAPKQPKATAKAETQIGRPSKISPEIQRSVVALLRGGNTRRAAAEASGISEARFYDWMKRGKEEKTGDFREFREAVTRAESEAEVLMVESVRKAARGYEKRTTRTKSRVEIVNGSDGKPLVGKDGKPVTQTVTETVEIVGFEFHPAIALEWLKRRRRDDWSERIENTGADGGPIQISTPAMSAAQIKLNKWREKMTKDLETSPG